MREAAAVRIGLVGCGRLAELGWVPALARVPTATLTAVADVRPERCAAVAPDAVAFESASALAESGLVDAVVVATPAEFHAADAGAVAAAGLLALVEKPPGVDGRDARALAALDPAPALGFNRRFDPQVRAVRTKIRQERPLRLELVFTYRRSTWGAHAVADDVLLDVGPHVLDLARWLSRSEIAAARATRLTHDRAELTLDLGAGTATIVCAADAAYREAGSVWAADGTRIGRWARGGLRDRVRSRLWTTPLVVSLTAQLVAFCRTVHGEPADALADTADGVAVMDAIAACRASAAAAGERVTLAGWGTPTG